MFDVSPEILNGVVAVVSGLASAIGAWMVSNRKQRTVEKKTAQTEMEALIKANTDFREEIRKDLADARNRISGLEAIINNKDKRIRELEADVDSLRNELSTFKKNVPPLST